MSGVGTVYLVGAGPGDARLLTLRAAELLDRADVVVVDALVSKEIAARIPASAHIVYAGKRASAHTLPQDEINQLLIGEARRGKMVVRLKGGDPFVFGRGGEEAEELMAAGVPIEIVPGISSAIAGPAYAGIPVTHRSHATSVTLVTGHEADSGSTGIRWGSLAELDGTIVFMMGLGRLGTICHQLMKHGVSPSRPVAVISNATRADQRTVTGKLRNIEMQVAEAKLPAPALIVVGSVVDLHDTINWFESRPLFGKRVVVTRAREQASTLSRLLEDAGANVLQFPAIEIAPPESWSSLDRVMDERWDWLVFTSTNGVRFFFERWLARGLDARALAGTKIAAVGDTTAAELRARGIVPDVVPERFLSTALLPHLPSQGRIAIIRAEKGSDALLDELRARGAEVALGIAYQTKAAGSELEELRALIAAAAIDVVTFTSASTVEHFYEKLSDDERTRVNARALLASIGPATSEAIRRYGKEPDIVAENASVDALFAGVVGRLVG